MKRLEGRDYVREIVRARDKYICQKCERKWKKGERRFDVHHLGFDCGIKTKAYDRKAETAGLITLCHRCHLNLPEVRKKMSVQKTRLDQMSHSPYKEEIIRKLKEQALALYKTGLSFRDVGKVVGRSHQWAKDAVDELTRGGKKASKDGA